MFRAAVTARPTATQIGTLTAVAMLVLAGATIVAASTGVSAPVVVVLALAALAVRPCAVLYHRRHGSR